MISFHFVNMYHREYNLIQSPLSPFWPDRAKMGLHIRCSFSNLMGTQNAACARQIRDVLLENVSNANNTFRAC
jgi:hypothetical protein